MKQVVNINNREIGKEYPVYFIAEMSANHLQDFDRAKDIIKAAKEAGADAIKLQTYRPDTITVDCRGEEFLATPGSPWDGMNLFELYKTAYTPWEWHKDLMKYAKSIGITCFSSPFDLTAVDFLEELDVPADMQDIVLALDTCKNAGNDNIILLKCVSEYPTPYSELNLRTIANMAETFNCVVGLSDHSMGDAVDVAGITLGARVVEKHLTLRRADGGPDSVFSMEPEEYKKKLLGR